VDEIEFSIEPIVIEEDPMIVWSFTKLVSEETKTISYQVNKDVEMVDDVMMKDDSHMVYMHDGTKVGKGCVEDFNCLKSEICIDKACIDRDFFYCGRYSHLEGDFCICDKGTKECLDGSCVHQGERCRELVDAIASPSIHHPVLVKEVYIQIDQETDGKADAFIEIHYETTFFGAVWNVLSRDNVIEDFIKSTEENLETTLDLIYSDLEIGIAIVKFHDFAHVKDDVYYSYNITAYPMKKITIAFPDCSEYWYYYSDRINPIEHEILRYKKCNLEAKLEPLRSLNAI